MMEKIFRICSVGTNCRIIKNEKNVFELDVLFYYEMMFHEIL